MGPSAKIHQGITGGAALAAEKIIRAFRVVPTLPREVFIISQRLLFHAFPHLKILLPQGVCMLSEAAKIEKFWMVLE